MIAGRLGVCCKWLEQDGTSHRAFAFRSLTRQNYLRQGDASLREVAFHNARVLHHVVCHLGRGPRRNRMFRIGNHVLPCRTLPEAAHAWRDRGFLRDLQNAYAAIGRRARGDGVRLSTHPDQFIVPNSANPDVRRRSIEELDAWAETSAWMDDDAFCMNVHLGPRLDGTRATVIASWRVARKAMSARAWRVVTVENDDKVWTAFDLVHAARAVGFRPVVDVHHHWVVSGTWLDPSRLGEVLSPLWRGERPKLHLSLPRADYYRPRDLDARGLPVLSACHGPPRPHARMPWAPGVARYARGLLLHGDIALELKAKNLARDALWRGIDSLEES